MDEFEEKAQENDWYLKEIKAAHEKEAIFKLPSQER